MEVDDHPTLMASSPRLDTRALGSTLRSLDPHNRWPYGFIAEPFFSQRKQTRVRWNSGEVASARGHFRNVADAKAQPFYRSCNHGMRGRRLAHRVARLGKGQTHCDLARASESKPLELANGIFADVQCLRPAQALEQDSHPQRNHIPRV